MDSVILTFQALGDVSLVLAAMVGVAWGILGGAMPGISPSITMALLLPFTYTMEPGPAIVLLASTYLGAEYGGSVPAMLVLLSKPLAGVALAFTPPAYFALCVLGLSVIATLSGETLFKGFAAALLGLMIATVGSDPVTGGTRFTFGSAELLAGIEPVMIMVGLFAMSELLRQAGDRTSGERVTSRPRISFPGPRMARRLAVPQAIGASIGTFEGGPVHSGVVIVPALIAAAQSHGFDNRRLTLGIVVGCELLCRLALAVPKAVHKAGFHPTAVLGAFAATVGICAATGASRATTVNALGIVGSMASGIIEYLGDGSWTKRMHPGWAAASALKAHDLAAAGFIGPRQLFDGTHGAFAAFAPSITADPRKVTDGLGARWVMQTVTFKPYPCGTMVQPCIDCAIALKRQGAPLDGIARITCKTAEGIVHRLWEPLDLKRRPPTAYAAEFSVPFGVALGLQRGEATLDGFSDAALADAALMGIAGKVGFQIDPNNPYPAAFTGHLRIDYDDGRSLAASQDHMRGGVADPLSRAEIDATFRANCAFGGATPDQAAQLLDTCNRIASGDPDSKLYERFSI